MVNGDRHSVLSTVSIDTSKMENPTTLIILSGYIKGTKELVYLLQGLNGLKDLTI